jgi:nucleoside-diphosphate-sugar epimerase
MKVLVIGGTGLIGSQVVAQLVERGDEVWAISRGLSHRSPPAGVHHARGDRADAGFLRQWIDQSPRFDCVVDMICYEPADAEEAVRALSGRTGQYILTSTIDVYRKPATRYPYREDEPYGGIGSYATSKVACERIAFEAYERSGFPVTVIRPAATYGDRHPPVHSLGRSTTYLDRLRRGKPIVVHGDGTSFWVSCHAVDVAGALVGAVGNQEAIGRAYHATGEEWITWNDHHRTVARLIGAPEPRLVHIPTDILVTLAAERGELVRDNFQFNNLFDNSAAREDLGFRYTVRLEDGLPPWYRSLEEAGMIEDSDLDPFDDRLIDGWNRMIGAIAFERTEPVRRQTDSTPGTIS